MRCDIGDTGHKALCPVSSSHTELELNRGRAQLFRTLLARQRLTHSRTRSLARSLTRWMLVHWLAVARVRAIVHVVRERERYTGRLVLTCR